MLSKSCLSSFVKFCFMCQEIPFLFPKTCSGKTGIYPELTDVLQADIPVHFLLVAKRTGFLISEMSVNGHIVRMLWVCGSRAHHAGSKKSLTSWHLGSKERKGLRCQYPFKVTSIQTPFLLRGPNSSSSHFLSTPLWAGDGAFDA